MTKRILAMLLAVIMVVGVLPMSVFAEGSTAEEHTKYEPQSAHTDAAHICEHCIAAGKSEAEATITWTPWGDDAGETNLPNTAGHYYLTKDMSVKTAEITSGHVVLCLNGKTVTASGTAGNANDRFYTLKNAGSVTILDCTAHVEEVEGQQVYKAGVPAVLLPALCTTTPAALPVPSIFMMVSSPAIAVPAPVQRFASRAKAS